MSESVEIYGFDTSNNFKVRVALGYKGIPFAFHRIDPADRDEVVRISGQFLTPVLVHGEVVLFDSAAILRYLEANFQHTPRLFGNDRDEQWAIEDWERFGRGPLAEGMMKVVHARVSGGGDDPEMHARAARSFARAVDRVVERLAHREWLVGDSMTAADVTCAAVVFRIAGTGVLPMPDELGNVPAWVERVMAYDRVAPGDGPDAPA